MGRILFLTYMALFNFPTTKTKDKQELYHIVTYTMIANIYDQFNILIQVKFKNEDHALRATEKKIQSNIIKSRF